MITKLRDSLTTALQEADEIYVAVALMSTFGLNFLEKSLVKRPCN
jgi:hypothetical protein